MLNEVSPYSEKTLVNVIGREHAVGYRLALREYCWCSAQAEAWLGPDDMYKTTGRLALYVDVLPPRPQAYQKPVFLCETRREAFTDLVPFGQGELLRLLHTCSLDSFRLLRSTPHDNLFLLSGENVATVHWLPGYGLWQLHVTSDWPYQVNPGTRIFALV